VSEGAVYYQPGPEDSRQIAELYQMAAGGVADYMWSGMAEAGETVLDVGARRFARRGEDYSFQNCLVAAREGAIIGMIHAYPMRAATNPGEDFDPVLRPYAELERVPSLYIAGIAMYPGYRGQGIGETLLGAFGMYHSGDDLNEHSLIAFEQNAGSVRLYERLGYEIVDRRPIVPHELIQYAGDALLMVRAF